MPFLVRNPVGGAPEERYPLKPGGNSIGRSRENDVVLHDASLSRLHARIDVGGDAVEIFDLGSRNGTFVGGSRVTEPVSLRDGDEIALGCVRVSYRRFDASPSTATKSGA